MKGLVLHSGGIDSTVCLALALKECEDVLSLGLFYNGKHNKREAQAARDVIEYYNKPRLLYSRRGLAAISSGIGRYEFDLPDIFSGFGSSLMDADKPNPHLTYEQLRESEGPSSTYVPMRNINLLAVASALALVKEFDTLYFGAHADDARNYAYPDCTPEFNGAVSNALHIGSYYKLRLKTPLQWMTKAEIVELGNKLGIPFKLTYSCYEGRDFHCGLCPTCIARKEAFKEANVQDPTEYEV